MVDDSTEWMKGSQRCKVCSAQKFAQQWLSKHEWIPQVNSVQCRLKCTGPSRKHQITETCHLCDTFTLFCKPLLKIRRWTQMMACLSINVSRITGRRNMKSVKHSAQHRWFLIFESSWRHPHRIRTHLTSVGSQKNPSFLEDSCICWFRCNIKDFLGISFFADDFETGWSHEPNAEAHIVHLYHVFHFFFLKTTLKSDKVAVRKKYERGREDWCRW